MNDKDLLDEVLSIVFSALDTFYRNDAELFTYDTNDPYISERGMVFHIGRYMFNELERCENSFLSELNIDFEYNRFGTEYVKQLIFQSDNRESVYPDLVIHKRKEKTVNIAVFEFKKSTNNNLEAINHDIDKLKIFTNRDSKYYYRFGFHITLSRYCYSLKVFQNQEVIKFICRPTEFIIS